GALVPALPSRDEVEVSRFIGTLGGVYHAIRLVGRTNGGNVKVYRASNLTVSSAKAEMPHHPLRIAHRGMPRRARENTLASFALALAAGADGIELDVHATSDGVVVVQHDPDLTTGAPIAFTSHAELLEQESDGAQIPTLGEVCALLKGRAELFVEIKGAGIEGLVVDALSEYDGPTAIHSFDHDLITRLAAEHCPYPLGVLFDDAVDVRTLLERTGARDVWPHHSLVTRELVDVVHFMGGRVIPWTVNGADDVTRVTSLGVDGICTDDVSVL
ncbi:MAG: glycerophosphodiester phosphodiesterase, partial [bacterium]